MDTDRLVDTETYYKHICNEWNVTPTTEVYTGYEHVHDQLTSYSKEQWSSVDDAGKQKIEDEIFDVQARHKHYRNGPWPIEQAREYCFFSQGDRT